MNPVEKRLVRIALLDLYEGHANEGMRCIRELVRGWGEANNLQVQLDEFEVRQRLELPDTTYDCYISSGGPGSPLESEGLEWENRYFGWIKSMEEWNTTAPPELRRHVLFICHSYQLACRYFGVGRVCERKSTAFGVFPVHMLVDGKNEPVFAKLNDPFYSVDSRDFQVIEPNHTRMREMGARILAIEKNRPHVPYERAMMAIRFNDHFIGTQFHPEADAEGMRMYLLREDKKQTVVANHGEAKWQSMTEQLQDPRKIMWTYQNVLPNFLNLTRG